MGAEDGAVLAPGPSQVWLLLCQALPIPEPGQGSGGAGALGCAGPG